MVCTVNYCQTMRRSLKLSVLRVLEVAVCALSLLLGVATCVMWVRSQWVPDLVQWTHGHHLGNSFDSWHWEAHNDCARSCKGFLYLWRNEVNCIEQKSRVDVTWGDAPRSIDVDGDLDAIRLPYFAILFSFAVPPVIWVCIFRARCAHRHLSAHRACRVCGYDIRATLERCPECGSKPEADELPQAEL